MRNLLMAIVAGALLTFATGTAQAQRYGGGGGYGYGGRSAYSSSFRGASFGNSSFSSGRSYSKGLSDRYSYGKAYSGKSLSPYYKGYKGSYGRGYQASRYSGFGRY